MFGVAARGIPSFGDKAWVAPVVAATAAALPAYTRSGDTITANANGAFPTIDGTVGPSVGQAILFRHGVAAFDNGIYTIVSVGSAGSKWSMTRRSDTTPTATRMIVGQTVYVLGGNLNQNRTFTLIVISGDYIYTSNFETYGNLTPFKDYGTFTITGQGTATYTTKYQYLWRIGSLCIINFGWTVNAAGSTATALSISNLQYPTPLNTVMLTGDRSVTSGGRLIGRLTSGTAAGTFQVITSGAVSAALTGADLGANGVWTFWGTYLTTDPM